MLHQECIEFLAADEGRWNDRQCDRLRPAMCRAVRILLQGAVKFFLKYDQAVAVI